MSSRKENPETVKARNAQPARARLRQAQGNLFGKNNREHENERKRLLREEKGPQSGIHAQMLQDAFDPLEFESGNIILSCDWHIPLQNENVVARLFEAAEENGTEDLAIAGDFFDCDNISKFNSITNSPVKDTFKGEREEVAKMLKRLLNVFPRIYICSGNHEYRWAAITAGNSDVKDLYTLTFPAGFDGGKFEGRIRLTNDDHMILHHNDQRWLLCHPRNFRITPLSVARDLAGKHLSNVFMAHGHGFNQGRDRSGQYICLDGGGLFDRAAMEYARRTSCHPMTRSGFYLLKDGKLSVFEGEA